MPENGGTGGREATQIIRGNGDESCSDPNIVTLPIQFVIIVVQPE